MPPVRSRLLNLLMALSLLLCVAVSMLWVRSYWQADCLFFWNTRGEWSAETSAGYLSVETSNIHGGDAGVWRLVTPSASVAFYRRVMRSRAVHSFAGFVYAVDVRPSSAVGLMAELESRGIRTPPGTLTRRFCTSRCGPRSPSPVPLRSCCCGRAWSFGTGGCAAFAPVVATT